MRGRSDTMEEFDKFEGDFQGKENSTVKNPQRTKKDKKNILEGQKIKEEYASFITLNNSDFDTGQSVLESMSRRTNQDRLEKIQSAIQSMCLLVNGIAKYLFVALPYPLKLKTSGFIIMDSSCKCYPLYLRDTSDKIADAKQQIQFENGIILLDKDIQYLLYINGYVLT